MKKWLQFAFCLLIPLAVGWVSSLATMEGVDTWYTTIQKPPFNPPNAVFGPVWTVLYILMGISLFLVVRQPASPARTKAIVVFAIQLFFNFWWSLLFFRFHLVGIALIDILLLFIFILIMINRFLKVKHLAGHLQWPYAAWVSFATVLNAWIWYYN